MSSSVSVAWTGSDASGIQSYDVQYTRATWNGKPGPPVAGLTNTTATTATLTGIAQGSEYCFQVRAKDWAGNVSGWSKSRCTAIPLDDRAMSASSGWKKLSARSFYSGTAMQATSKGRTLTRKGAATGRAVLLVDEGKGYGAVDVLYNGKVVKTLSLVATRTRNQVAVTLPSIRKANTTIVVRTRSARKVLIDGLLLARV
jgi:hypothetical protein